MSQDSYRAIYDAVFAQFDISWEKERAMQNIALMTDTIREQSIRPSVLMRPALTLDGNQWCLLYGENLMEGVAGFGDTPEQAAEAFDAAWKTARAPSVKRSSLDEAFPGI